MGAVRFPGTPIPAPGAVVRVDLMGIPVAVFNLDGQVRAIEARCPHRGGPLERGVLTGTVVTCPWHGSQFDVATGKLVRGPATRALRTYPARVDAGILVIDAP